MGVNFRVDFDVFDFNFRRRPVHCLGWVAVSSGWLRRYIFGQSSYNYISLEYIVGQNFWYKTIKIFIFILQYLQ